MLKLCSCLRKGCKLWHSTATSRISMTTRHDNSSQSAIDMDPPMLMHASDFSMLRLQLVIKPKESQCAPVIKLSAALSMLFDCGNDIRACGRQQVT